MVRVRYYDMRIPNWYRVQSGDIRVCKAWNLHSSGLVRHGYSTRIGGLNMSLAVGDDRDSVLENRRAFASVIGVDAGRIVVPDQVHSDVVTVVNESDAGAGAFDHSSAVPDADALITNTPNLPLALHFADCGCVFLVDPENKAIGIAHAGWRGTALKIVQATIKAMEREFGSDPQNMLAAIAPAIGRCCYEVGEDTAKELFKAFLHDERVLRQISSNKWRADIKTANHILLLEAGLKDMNIAVSEECTSCNGEEFFSYRRDGNTGRMSGWLSLV